jgi:hypothetical protein
MVESEDDEEDSDLDGFIVDDEEEKPKRRLVKGQSSGKARQSKPKDSKDKGVLRQTTLVSTKDSASDQSVATEKPPSSGGGPAHDTRRRVAASAFIALDALKASNSIPLSKIDDYNSALKLARSEIAEYQSKDYKYAVKSYDLIESLVRVISVQNVIIHKSSRHQSAQEAKATMKLATSVIDACDNLPAISKVNEHLLSSAEAVNKLLNETRKIAGSLTVATRALGVDSVFVIVLHVASRASCFSLSSVPPSSALDTPPFLLNSVHSLPGLRANASTAETTSMGRPMCRTGFIRERHMTRSPWLSPKSAAALVRANTVSNAH